MLINLLSFFSISSMVKKHSLMGELPSTKTAYHTYISLAWPAALEGILVSLISSVDIIMVGSLGPAAIAAVGLTTQPKFIVLAVINSLNIGVTALTARRKGEGNIKGSCSCLKQSLIICLCLCFLLNFVTFFFAEDIMIFAGAQPDVLPMATIYFKIILISNFFTSLSLTINAAQRGVGNTKISMRTNITANIVNLFFNYLLINGVWGFPRLEVAGAAIATAIGCIVSCIMSFLSVLHSNRLLSIRGRFGWKFDKKTILGITKVGSSALAEQAFMRFGLFTYAKIVANLGTIAFAAHQIGMNVLNLSFSFGDGIGSASSSLTGQTLGAKRPDLSTVYGKIGQRCALVAATILGLVFFFGRGFITSLFTNDLQVMAQAADLMIIIAVTCLVQTSGLVYSGCLRGAGDTIFVAVISLVSIAIIRPAISWFLCYPVGFGLFGAWIGLLLDQVLRLVLSFWRFRSNKWQNIIL